MQSVNSGAGLHVAIVMDGNGRWATRRGLPRVAGHAAGVEALRRTVEAAPDAGIAILTVFAFSADNWRRPRDEVDALMGLLATYLIRDTARLAEAGVRLGVIGRRDRLAPGLVATIEAAERATAAGTKLWLRVAVDYSAREAIRAAAQCGPSDPAADFAAALAGAQGLDPEPSPDVDLLIRTGGERRLSDFLLWESAYAELRFIDLAWPDFGEAALAEALADFAGRQRRFGALPRPPPAPRDPFQQEDMTMDETERPASSARSRVPPPGRIAWIVGIALATLVPSLLVSQLVGEREARSTDVRNEVARAWGPEQTIVGPTLMLPVTTKDGSTRYLTLAPRALEVKADVVPTTRRRGLFSTTVYDAAIAMSGRFELPEGFREGGPDAMKRGQAVVLLGLGGTQGVRDDDHIEIGGSKTSWQACSDVLQNEAVCRRVGEVAVVMLADEVDLGKATGQAMPFELTVHVRGTGALRLASSAKHTMAQIAGAWPTPSFVGTDLPNMSKSTEAGFQASWTLDRIGRPAYTTLAHPSATSGPYAMVGVDLIEGAPLYRTINRVAKYGVVIVVLAFTAFFLFEVAAAVRVALFQYGMLGASLSLFTLLLLSFAEIAGYELGYALCASMVTAQASLYTLSVTRRAGATAAFAAMLAGVFGFFYALVGLESYSLVVGAVALFLVLSIVMGVTEKVMHGARRAGAATAGSQP